MSQHIQKTTTYISTYQHNGTPSVLTIYTCIAYLFQQLRYYFCKLDFNSKAFKTYTLNFMSLETLVQAKSYFNFYMIGLGPVIFRNISFSEVSKYKAFDNEVVFIFNCVKCNTLSIFTWNTVWAMPPTGFNKKIMRR